MKQKDVENSVSRKTVWRLSPGVFLKIQTEGFMCHYLLAVWRWGGVIWLWFRGCLFCERPQLDWDPLSHFDFQTCVDLSKEITLILSRSHSLSAVFSSATSLVVCAADRRHGTSLTLWELAEKHGDDDVHLQRELLVTMMVIRISMMTTTYMRRHRNRLVRLTLGEGVPLHTHTHTHTWLDLKFYRLMQYYNSSLCLPGSLWR